MNPRAAALSIALPALLVASLSAQAPQKPEAPKSEIQTRAETLMDHARHLSDIRSKGAPAFRLSATFSFIGADLDAVQGTYTEVWVSPSQWWRETVANKLRRVEVGGPNRRWLLEPAQEFPDPATNLPDLIKLFPPSGRVLDFDSIADDAAASTTECAITKPGSAGEKSAFCFDKKSGALLQKVSPDIRPKNAVSLTCVYGIFRKTGEFWFPREMACFEDKHRKLEAKVIDISAELAPKADLFKPPPGAVELADCQGETIHPRTINAAGPNLGFFQNGKSAAVTLSAIIEKNGRADNLQVRKSGGKAADDIVLRTVSGWLFKPGTCDGEAIPMQLKVEMTTVVP